MRVAGSINIKYHPWADGVLGKKKKSQILRDRRCKLYNNRVYGMAVSTPYSVEGFDPDYSLLKLITCSQSVVSRLIIPVSHHLSHLSPLRYMPYNKALYTLYLFFSFIVSR